MSIELKEAAQQVLKELGEARKIVRASSSRQLAKDWDRRATDALANLRAAIQQAEAQQPSSKEHLFELWWEAHMPNATQEQAWTAFTAAVASNGVGIAAQQPATGEPVGYQEIFNAIAAATEVQAGAVAVSVKAFTQAIGAIYTHPAPSVPDDVRHIVGWWLCNEANPQDGSPWTTEPSQRVLDHMKVVSGEKHTVMRLVAIDAAMLAAK